jgi:hypothetical protein
VFESSNEKKICFYLVWAVNFFSSAFLRSELVFSLIELRSPCLDLFGANLFYPVL